ncbi:putative protein OS=Kitasatospora aureofaciens OX=1894 GN=GCM10010502_11400 PE=4 SV=1 [Kitasatospora aureofaciens]|uniref:Uncharacterized protein n=1 Tax=Kitasatospora aureofaciens TaxID=1894 RepID=A0A8H9HFQ0_KITAU|nr:hypothetical protein GCM10010502_11400 [Kitasatospora aureofaciens]
MKRPGYAIAVVLDIVLLVGLVQGWLPTSSEGFREFLVILTTVILSFVLFSAIRPNRRD